MSMQRCSSLCIVVGALALSALAPPALANADANALLMRMNQAFAELDYDGVFTYANGTDLTALRVVHKVVDGQQKERLVHLNGAPREILRHGESVVCIVMPGDDIAALEESIPAGPFARAFVREFERLSDSYRVEAMGEGRVAGRLATRVAVMPLDEYRYGYRLWLDTGTSLLLRSELVNANGERLEVFQFSQVLFGDAVNATALDPESMQGSMVSHLTLKGHDTLVDHSGPVSTNQWRLSWLPPGFEMASMDLRRKPASKQDVASMVYSDGLATFSVFVETMPLDGSAEMVARNGATIALTRAVQHGSRSYLASLVGEIPERAAQRVLAGLRGR